MEELKVVPQLGSITTNLDSIGAELKETLKEYEGYVVSQDTITSDKKVLANLRKLRTDLEDARKSVKKEWEKPYKDFENKYKKVLALVDEPIELIDKQLKMFEEERAAEKLKHVQELYAKEVGEYAEYLPFEDNFNPKWLNASIKDKDILYDISEKKIKIISDINVIKGLDSEIEDVVLKVYKNSGNDLAKAIQRNTEYLQDKVKVVSTVKSEPAKEETKPKAEAMGSLNDMVQMTKTVTFIVSAEDADRVENMLSFEDISYRRVEE